jgi:hypothetical protein
MARSMIVRAITAAGTLSALAAVVGAGIKWAG